MHVEGPYMGGRNHLSDRFAGSHRRFQPDLLTLGNRGTVLAAPVTVHYVRPILFAVSAVTLVLVAWSLRDVFLLLFGALILATALQAAVSLVERFGGLSRRWALAATILFLIVLSVTGTWLIGDRLVAQFDELSERLPEAIETARNWLGDRGWGKWIADTWGRLQDGGIPWERLGGAAGITIGAVGNTVLLVLLGIYLAADPALYRDGFVRLIPVPYRPRASSALTAAGDGLGSWLMGQGISMLFVGTATAIGLALLGSPLALSLGVIAGIFAFIPYFGPIASGVLAVALSFIEGPRTALYVAGLCFVIQQIEGNVLMPFVQRWAVALPPVLALIAVVVFGLLFGVVGVIFATPLMVVVMVLVKKLYVQDVLEAGSEQPNGARP